MYPKMPETKHVKGIYKDKREGTYYLAIRTEDEWKRISKWRREEEMKEDIKEFINRMLPFRAESEKVGMNQESIDEINSTLSERKQLSYLLSDFPEGFYYENRRWGRIGPSQRCIQELHMYKWMGKYFVYADVYDFLTDRNYPEAVSVKTSLLEMAQDIETYKHKIMSEQTPMGIAPEVMEANIIGKIAASKMIELDSFETIVRMETRINNENPNREEWVLPPGDYPSLKFNKETYFKI